MTVQIVIAAKNNVIFISSFGKQEEKYEMTQNDGQG
jgi:hypothetical protein